jgi:hypothetical protein
MKWLTILSLMIVIMAAGCTVENPVEEKVTEIHYDVIEMHDDGDGLIRLPASEETANMIIVANLLDDNLTVINQNDEVAGVRISRDSSAVLFSDGWIDPGESGNSDNVNLQYQVRYLLTARFYEFNFLDIISNLFDSNDEGAWDNVRSSYIRAEFTSYIIFYPR